MPAATTKTGLIAITEKEWAKLTRLIEALPETDASRPDAEGTTIKDVLAHRAHWIGLFFQWLEEGAGGGPVEMPDHGVKWNQLKPYNAALRETYAGLSWDEARAWLSAQHRRLLDWITAASDDTLYGGPMPGGTGWTTGRYAEASGPSHYRSAAKFIRASLRVGDGPGA
ncbi:hypothetical protein roselon_01672 [Roseibacterium elongatum DSM 19469]|uniref:DinB-like domain-containing protein n=1 Tax=Roseicyclus elongatus DSM 19469 TaxID=1294273 RepID=W8RSA4_9RHOB|nr:ClbS/DfsB family four-helix bundle protein [Roseibacterium elongatum]AHM04049.1 hypothetical protein roselon_01672 [Roseibacterium elongatum DSM 19469]